MLMPPSFQCEIDFEASSEEAGAVSSPGGLKITFLVRLFSDLFIVLLQLAEIGLLSIK
jgi:hypothetical protein